MRFVPNLLLVTAFLALLSALAPAAPTAPAAPSNKQSNKLKAMAPADQYFGKLKLSFLGINNTFRDAGISAADHTADPAIAGKVDFAIDALNDWQKKFPRDPQLSRTYFLAQLTLKKIWIQKYQDKAWAYMQYIVVTYPATFYGKTVKAEIARGWTSHYYAASVPCDAAATPAPSVTTTPSVTTNNGKYKTAVETPPCITPSPSPSPSVEPSPPSEASQPAALPSGVPAIPVPAASPAPVPPVPSGSPVPAASPVPLPAVTPAPGTPAPGTPAPAASPVTPAPADTPIPSATIPSIPTITPSSGSPVASPSTSAT